MYGVSSCFALVLLVLLVLLAAAGCGGEPVAPDAGTPDAASDAAGRAAPPSIPWLDEARSPAVLTPCPEGWRTVEDDLGAPCDPYGPEGPRTCAAGEAHFPGESACRPVGDGCPPGDFAAGLPNDGTVVYVSASAAPGGDGSLGRPHAGLGEVNVALLPTGTTVALGKGVYGEAIALRGGVHVVGACAAETLLTGTAFSAPAIVSVTLGSEPAVLRNVTLSNAPQRAAVVGSGRALRLEGELYRDAHDLRGERGNGPLRRGRRRSDPRELRRSRHAVPRPQPTLFRRRSPGGHPGRDGATREPQRRRGAPGRRAGHRGPPDRRRRTGLPANHPRRAPWTGLPGRRWRPPRGHPAAGRAQPRRRDVLRTSCRGVAHRHGGPRHPVEPRRHRRPRHPSPERRPGDRVRPVDCWKSYGGSAARSPRRGRRGHPHGCVAPGHRPAAERRCRGHLDLTIARVQRTACEATTCPEQSYGYGVAAQGGALDLERLTDDVVYRDNGTNLDATALPVPELPLGISAVDEGPGFAKSRNFSISYLQRKREVPALERTNARGRAA